MNKKIRIILKYLSSMLILIGSIYFIFGPFIEEYMIKTYRPSINELVINSNLNNKNANYDWSNVTDTNLYDVTKSRMNNRQNVVALMTQPKAKVAVTIVNGVNNNSLNLSAGTVRADQKIGEDNYVLAAHHVPKADWALFSGIYYFSDIGQKVYITDMSKVYEYTITDIKFVEDTDVSVTYKENYMSNNYGIIPGSPMFTAISCDSTGESKRIVEFGTLTNTYDFNKKDIPTEAVDGFERAADFSWSR